MYSTCLHCTRDLGRNNHVETLPIGRRLAFDADKGRLWVVCASCGKWNLVPFDTRLESIDACEKLFRDTRTRYSTDNIGMAKVGDGLTLVRVGKALRPEFASWRYGEQYRKRRRSTMVVAAAVGVGIAGVAVAMTGILGIAAGGYAGSAVHAWYGIRQATINSRARIATISRLTSRPLMLEMEALMESNITWAGGDPVLRVPRWPGDIQGQLVWQGSELASMGRRVAGGLNQTAGTTRQIESAVEHLAAHNGDLTAWLPVEAKWQRKRRLDGPTPSGRDPFQYRATANLDQVTLSDASPEHRLAIEMWFSEDIERRWLEGELRLLEREWKEAETLAKIADDLVLEPAS